MTRPPYIPERGDLVWLTFDPQVGVEQAGRRPALVISTAAFNSRVGLAMLCPITRKRKSYPFEVEIPDGSAIEGVVLVDQAKILDWRGRRAEYAGRAPDAVVDEARAFLARII